MIDASSEQKFLILKKRLDALHYCQPLTIESAALVEKLLNDLIKTTEGFQNQKKNNDQVQKELIRAESYLQPLKTEAHKLQTENNQLHLSMIQVKEDAEEKDMRWQTQQKAMQGENRDLKFVLQQKESRLRKIESENLNLQQKLDSFMAKVFLPSSQKGLENLPPEYLNENIRNPINISMGNNFKAGSEFSKTILNPEQQQLAEELFSKKQNDYKSWADSLKVADERNEKMKSELNSLAEDKAVIEEQLQHQELLIKNRNNEIQRLQAKLDLGSVNMDKMSVNYELEQQIEKVGRLNHQIDFLTKENTKIQSENREQKTDLSRTKTMREENDELQRLVRDLNIKLEQCKHELKNQDYKTVRLTDTMKESHQTQIDTLEQENTHLYKKIDLKQSEIESLNSRIERLFQENEELGQKADKSESLVAAYQSDKRAFANTIDQVKMEKQGDQEKQSELQEKLMEKNEKIQELEQEIVNIQQKLQSSQREINLNTKAQERLVTENKVSQEEINKLKSSLQLIEQENLNLINQKSDLSIECERAQNQRQYLEEQLQQAKEDTYNIRGTIDSKEAMQERNEVLLEGQKNDNIRLRNEVNTLETLLSNSKEKYVDSEQKATDYFRQMKAQTETVKEIEKQHRITSDLLANKIKDLRAVENIKNEYEREVYELRGIKNQLNELQQKQRSEQSDVSQQELQRIRFNKQIDELKMDIIDKEENIKSLKIEIEQLNKDNDRLQGKVSDVVNESDNLNSNMIRLQEKEAQYSSLLGELERVKERERKLISENSSLQTNLRQAESLIVNGTKNVQHLSNQKDDLLTEIKGLQERLAETKNVKSDTVSKSIQQQEQINNLNIHLSDLQDSLKKEEKKAQNSQNETKLLTSEINLLKQDKSELEQSVKSLSTLAEGLERTREELLERLRRKGQENNGIEEGAEQAQKEIHELKDHIQNIENELQTTRDSLISIDSDRDHMQGLLDEKCEENIKMKRILEQNEVEFQKLKDRCIQMQGKSDMGTKRTFDLEKSLKDNSQKISQVLQELDNAKYTIQIKQKELSDLSNDLNVVVRENQNINNQLVKIISERDQYREQLNALNIEDKKQKQSFRATQMEKTDILNNYREVSLENERLQRNIQDLTFENQQILLKLKEYEKEIAGVTHQIQHNEQKEQQMHADMHALERQQTFLTKRLEQEQQANQELVRERDNAFREFENMRKVNEGMNNSREEFQRSMVHQQNDKQYLQDQIAQLKRENDALKTQNEFEQQRSQQLEDVVMKERQNQHQGQLQFSNVQSERENLLKQIDQQQMKNQNLQAYINKLEADNKNNESQNVDNSVLQEFQRTNDEYQKKVDKLNEEVQSLLHEQRYLREENSKLRLNNYKLETEKQELDKRISANDTIKSGRQQQYSGEQDIQQLSQDNQQFQSTLQEISQKSQQLSQQVKEVQKEYAPSQNNNNNEDDDDDYDEQE